MEKPIVRTVEVEYLPNGDMLVPIPNEYLEKLGWDETTTIEAKVKNSLYQSIVLTKKKP